MGGGGSQRGRGVDAFHLLPKRNIYSFLRYFLPRPTLCQVLIKHQRNSHKIDRLYPEFISLVKNTDQQTAFPS